LCQRLGRTVQERCGLSTSVGLAKGKFPAWVAAMLANSGSVKLVPPGEEATFLADLPIGALPMEAEIARRLRLLGIATLGQLAALPAGAVSTQFGKAGSLVRQLAAGQDVRPVIPHKPGAAARVVKTFEGGLTDRLALEAALRLAASELAGRLEAEGRKARSLELVLRLEGGQVRDRRLTLRQPTASADRLGQTFIGMVSQIPLRSGVLAVEINLPALVGAVGRQLDLFSHQNGQEQRLQAALQDTVARYGVACFYWVTLAERKSLLPERNSAFRTVERL
jgi:DNA polymerase-4